MFLKLYFATLMIFCYPRSTYIVVKWSTIFKLKEFTFFLYFLKTHTGLKILKSFISVCYMEKKYSLSLKKSDYRMKFNEDKNRGVELSADTVSGLRTSL